MSKELSSSPARVIRTIVPDDSNDLPDIWRALYMGSIGNVVIVDSEGTTTSITVLNAGQTFPISPVRILVTGTTVTPIIGYK